MDKGRLVHIVLIEDFLSYLCSDILNFCLFSHFALVFICSFLYCHLQKKERQASNDVLG